MAEPTVTLREAEAHEALLLRLEALLGELRPLAARHPLAAVPAPLIALSESLLFDARAFTPRRRREALPAAAPDFAGLVVQLGQALAALDAFEARRSFWSAGRAAFVWRLGARGERPIGRLRPHLAQLAGDERAGADKLRAKLRRQIEARVAEAYEQGLRDARNGILPPG